jgi:RNA polymerase sigma factor
MAFGSEVRLMLSLLLFKKKKKTLEEIAVEIQNGNDELLNQLLSDYKPFVKKAVSKVCKRYINESDDEFSIGLIAFHEAIQKYEHTKGASLLSFAEVIVKRKVIDYLRKHGKHQPLHLEINGKEEQDEQAPSTLVDRLSIEEFEKNREIEIRREEILRYQQDLLRFGLTFDDLVKNSPKHEDARMNAIQVAKTLMAHENLKNYLFQHQRLPIKELEQLVSVSRKTIERNRKYIIAIALILSGDYVYLLEYIKGRMDG